MYLSSFANVVVWFMLVAILFSLGYGLFVLLFGQRNGKNIYKALAWRIGLSMLLFMGLILVIYFGLIIPGPPPL